MNYQELKKHIPSSVKRKNKTGFKGVKQNGGKFQSNISIKFREKVMTKSLGNFDSPSEAYKARVEFIKELL